jgi:hypothetical protein
MASSRTAAEDSRGCSEKPEVTTVAIVACGLVTWEKSAA